MVSLRPLYESIVIPASEARRESFLKERFRNDSGRGRNDKFNKIIYGTLS